MKRLFAILLCLVMLLSLAACSKAPNEPNNETNEGNTVTVPTKEEQDQIEKYKTALHALNKYVKEGYIPAYKVGEEYLNTNESLGCYYKDIQDSEYIEKWIGTEYASDDAINWNRQEILDNFAVIEDVLLQTNIQGEDKLGNVKTRTHLYVYGMDGNLIEESTTGSEDVIKLVINEYPQIGWEPLEHGNRVYIYENNRLVKMQCYYKGKISSTLTPTYNDDGLKIKDTYLGEYNSNEYTYTYDSEGYLISVKESDGYHTILFEYDKNGYLTKMDNIQGDLNDKWDWKSADTSLYTYNEDYSVCTEERYREEWCSDGRTGEDVTHFLSTTFTLDEKGRILTGEVLTDYEGEKIHQEQVYGNYYIYKPAMQNDASK